MREGAKGAKSFYYILFTHIGFNWEKWLHEILARKAMWFLISCNYINNSLGCLGVHLFLFILLLHSFLEIVIHSLFLIRVLLV
jgi:hypothetical protein